MSTPIAYAESLRLAYSLRHPDDWARAIAQLPGPPDQASREGLIELLYRPPTARSAIAAVTALEACESRPLVDALHFALGSPQVYVRLAVIRSLQNRQAHHLAPVVSRLLERDFSWMIRRAALEFLAVHPSESRWNILKASTDPHWRVRHALIQVLLNWSDSEESRREIRARLQAAGNDVRTQGLWQYLEYRQTQQPPEPLPTNQEDPAAWCKFWDWDPAVLAWRLEQMPAGERREHLGLMPRLIGHDEERVRRWAAHSLLRDGEVPELLETLRWLDDPRHPAFETVSKLTEQLDPERIEQLVQSVFHLKQPSPGQWVWALEQIETTLSVEDISDFDEFCQQAIREGPRVRAALARMSSRVPTEESRELLRKLLDDPDSDVVLSALEGLAERLEAEAVSLDLPQDDWQRLLASDDPEIRPAATKILLQQEEGAAFVSQFVIDPLSPVRAAVAEWLVGQRLCPENGTEEWLLRLQRDESSLVRAAALTVSRAAELLKDPTQETSWLVLEHAARLCKTPLWNIAPESLPSASPSQPMKPAWLAVQPDHILAKRLLAGSDVSPLGISGHYGLPVEGFQTAMETGINLMFWEPNYQTLTDFLGRLSPRNRGGIHMVIGTFEASPARIRKDVERALAKLQIEQIAVFLLFWTRSWNRVTDAVREMLEQLQTAGMIGTYGLSTHSRPLAVEAIQSGWNSVMVRHSAAHRGAESTIFPVAQNHGTSLLTFNNTCYGRLLEEFSADAELSPADCYRYTLSFEAVTACWSAPATLEELQTNLAALHRPELPADRRERLCQVGERVYQEDTVFRQQVRGV